MCIVTCKCLQVDFYHTIVKKTQSQKFCVLTKNGKRNNICFVKVSEIYTLEDIYESKVIFRVLTLRPPHSSYAPGPEIWCSDSEWTVKQLLFYKSF